MDRLSSYRDEDERWVAKVLSGFRSSCKEGLKVPVEVVSVKDGDSLKLLLLGDSRGIPHRGGVFEARLFGIDAPELAIRGSRWGPQEGAVGSLDHLKELTLERGGRFFFTCRGGLDDYWVKNRDPRLVRVVGLLRGETERTSVNLQMIRDGWAHRYVHAKTGRGWLHGGLKAMEEAQHSRLGIWDGFPDRLPEPPKRYRERRREHLRRRW